MNDVEEIKPLSYTEVEDSLAKDTEYVVQIINRMITHHKDRITVKKTFWNKLTVLEFGILQNECFWFDKKTKKLIIDDAYKTDTFGNMLSMTQLYNLCSNHHLKEMFFAQGWKIRPLKQDMYYKNTIPVYYFPVKLVQIKQPEKDEKEIHYNNSKGPYRDNNHI